jgi:hypothetical protein
MLGFFIQFDPKQDRRAIGHLTSRISPVAPGPKACTFCLLFNPQGISFKNVKTIYFVS